MSALEKLVEHWRKIKLDTAPFLHQDDSSGITDQTNLWRGCEDAVETFRSSNHETRVVSDLYPAPFSGDIKTAKVYLLMLNPSWAPDDYHHQANTKAYRRAEQAALAQRDLDERFPNHYLNPNFCWSGGYRYWEKKLKHVAAEVRDRKKVSYTCALAEVSKSLATIELFPYRSLNFKFLPDYHNLRSVQLVKDFVKEVSECHDKLVIVLRQPKLWDLQHKENVLVYSSAQRQTASLGPNSLGWSPILDAICP